MTGSPEPEKETVQIIVSPARKPPSTGCETVRIHLPTRPPPDPSPPSNSPFPVSAATMPPHASAKPAVEMKQTQPLIDLPAVEMRVTKMTIAPPSSHPAPQMQIDDVPTPFYWALLATSAAILILQIWNYLS